jgi:glutathione peroxidase
MSDNSKSIHQFKVKLINGTEKKLSDYKNKNLLIVNIASACGFAPQLKELQQLREELKSEDFEVLLFHPMTSDDKSRLKEKRSILFAN